MKKFKLLLLDANVVIELWRLSLWEKVVDQCDVHLARTVVGEARFFEDDDGRHEIDLTADEAARRITVFELHPSEIRDFLSKFDPLYIQRLDPGEAESLGFLFRQSDECHICSADAIVFRVLGNFNRSGQGVSLEEILEKIGLGRKLRKQFTRSFRESSTQKGFSDGLGDLGRS